MFNPPLIIISFLRPTTIRVLSGWNFPRSPVLYQPPSHAFFVASGSRKYGEGTCHAAPYFNKSKFGGYYAQYDDPYGPYKKYDPPHWTVPIDRMPNTTDCLFCHNQSIGTIRNGWGNALQVNASNMFGNRYSISTDSCYACHTRNQGMPVDFHSNEVVLGGGPGCLYCHNNSNPQNFTGLNYIDGANFSISVHANMNSNNASGYGINASCWACHNSSGYVVANNTHPDKRDTPYTCPDCHLANGSNAGAYNATIISNHYRNGTNIRALDNRTSDLASCLGCHENVSGMITANNDTDYGSFASDGVGVNGGNMSFYHYGANRSSFGMTAGSYDYCIYCHSNVTGEFNSVFQDNANRSISNHSLRYNSSNPSCSVSVCHNSTNSSLHGVQLIKPNINITLYNSSYCLSCHGLNVSNGATNYTGAVTTYKEMHNNSVNCTECHTGPDKKNIHPMTYLQPNGTYYTGNQTAVNCTDCHQQNTLDSQLSKTPPKVSTVQHGNSSLNSSFWNGTQQGYWTNTSQESMCDYCHGDSRHNATGLGRPSNWSGSNIMNSSITSNGNWCAGCHYQGYSNSEKFNINMTQSFSGVNLSVPPEITNSSIYSPYNLNGYYNHSLTPDYNDTTCKGCHGKSLSAGTISEFIHNINTGLCTSCHFSYDYMNGSVNKPDKYVNSTMFSASPHGSLACEDCHTKGHNDIGARKSCEDCHAYQSDPKNETERHNITSSPGTYNYNGINVVNITDCTVCHDSSYYNNAIASYGYNKTIDCNYCHTYPDKTYS
ncbi:MAG: cytochrome c3 family protein [Candidatus Methanoperedens sp.]|nr:cytochrome c3 family protein [Candidatus Methanoperedens sp.]